MMNFNYILEYLKLKIKSLKKKYTNMSTMMLLAEIGQKHDEVYYIDHGNGLIEIGTDEDARKFGIPKSKWEALQKYDLDRDPQFIEKLNIDTEEFYTTVLGCAFAAKTRQSRLFSFFLPFLQVFHQAGNKTLQYLYSVFR